MWKSHLFASNCTCGQSRPSILREKNCGVSVWQITRKSESQCDLDCSTENRIRQQLAIFTDAGRDVHWAVVVVRSISLWVWPWCCHRHIGNICHTTSSLQWCLQVSSLFSFLYYRSFLSTKTCSCARDKQGFVADTLSPTSSTYDLGCLAFSSLEGWPWETLDDN